MRLRLAVLVAVLVAAVSPVLLAHPAAAQDGAMLGDAPYLQDGAVVAPADGEIVVAAAVPAVDTSSRSAVASFFAAYYTGQPAIGWTGSQASCTAGTTSDTFKAAVIDRIAFYRAMAGVPSGIGLAVQSSAANQQAALMFSRNNQLSHTPSTSWACYTATGAQAAANSNIALGAYGVGAVDAYMKDAGSNNAAAGHRRWLLYPQTQSFGTGDVPPGNGYPAANAMWVWDSNVSGPRPSTRDGYVAWPPPGFVPYHVVFPRWSFSYPGAGFGGASVSVTRDGASIAVSVDSSTATGYGENTIVFRLDGMAHTGTWPRPAADTTYDVRISGVSVGGQSRTFTYRVTVFDPATAASATTTPTRTPTATPSRTPTSSPTPTATAPGGTASPTPTLIPGGYAPGEQFRTTTSINLRSGPGTSFAPLAVLPTGTLGQVTGAPVFANGYTFYPVTVTGYGSGWAAGEFFARVASTPTPSPPVTFTPTTPASPTRTATASPTPSRTPTGSPPTATPTRPPGGFVAGDTVRTTASVNLRTGPSTANSVIRVVPANTTGTIQGSGVVSGPNTFYPISVPGYGTGWIAGQYLTLVATSPVPPTATRTTVPGVWAPGTTVYTTTALNIRSGPGTSYAIRGVAPSGTSATVTGSPVTSGTMTWYPLQVTGIGAGWASATYLSTSTPVLGPRMTPTPPATGTATPTTPPSETATPPNTPTVSESGTLDSVPVSGEGNDEAEPSVDPQSSEQAADPTTAIDTDRPVETVQEPPADRLPIARVQRSPDSQPGQVLVDDDPSTVWFAPAAGQPLALFVLDLGEQASFSRIDWLPDVAGVSGTLYLAVSLDGETWTEIDPALAVAAPDGWLVLEVPATAQFVRFVFVDDTGAGAEWLGGIAEVRIIR